MQNSENIQIEENKDFLATQLITYIGNKRKIIGEIEKEIVSSLDSKFIVISYNSEGFISFEEMSEMLKKYGKLKTVEIAYNTFRGSRNLRNRDIHVSEYLFILEK